MNLPFFERDDVDIDDLWAEAEVGNRQAQFELGYMLLFGLCVRRQVGQGLEWLTRSAVAGHATAQAQIGIHFLFGGGAMDSSSCSAEAFKWLYLSARQREPEAVHFLGYCYFHGHGVTRNEEQAVALLLEAALLGNSDSQFQVARFYLEGIGLTRNVEQAQSWLTVASNQGNKDAKELLDQITSY